MDIAHMTTRKTQSQKRKTETGLRMLLVSSALTLTLGGWGILSLKNKDTIEENTPNDYLELESDVSIEFPAMPTLVAHEVIDLQGLPEPPPAEENKVTLRVVNSPRSSPSSSPKPAARTRSS